MMDHVPVDEEGRPRGEGGWAALLRAWETDAESQSRKPDSEPARKACRYIIRGSVEHALQWCRANDKLAYESQRVFEDVEAFVKEVYEAVTDSDRTSPQTKPHAQFWRHQDLVGFMEKALLEERVQPVFIGSVKSAADKYIRSPWLQNPFLDWVLMDALMFGETAIFMHEVMRTRFGFSYLTFGMTWKARLYRACMLPVSFALGWIAPAAFLWWLSSSYPQTALWSAVAYYGLSFILLLRLAIIKVMYRLREGKFPQRRISDLIDTMAAAYFQLREETIHVPSLKAALDKAHDMGASWPPQVYAILDLVAAKSASSWSRQLGTWRV
jgi:hypothetical protein